MGNVIDPSYSTILALRQERHVEGWWTRHIALLMECHDFVIALGYKHFTPPE